MKYESAPERERETYIYDSARERERESYIYRRIQRDDE